MTEQEHKKLGQTLWNIADQLRGAMNADDFRDYMLAFLFLRYLSDNYEAAAARELGPDYPALGPDDKRTPLSVWYAANSEDTDEFERQMRRKVHYVIQPPYLWTSIVEMARVQNGDLLDTLQKGMKFIEDEAFTNTFKGLFSEINLSSEKLGRSLPDRNEKLCKIITEIAKGLKEFSTTSDTLGDAYEYLIGQFAAGGGKKAGEFYTPQFVSDILSEIVALDSQDPTQGKRAHIDSLLDFACGSGSLILNVRNEMGSRGIGKIYGQEKNITTYNLARMNMLLHGVKDSEFEIFHGDTLTNDWPMLRETNPARVPRFDAVVANPPFSYRWDPSDSMADDVRFKNYGLAPKSAADFAFLLHGFHFLKDDGVMTIILPHGVLFRGGAEERIRTKLLKDGHIDTVIGLPANLFYSTGIPVCILVLKKCKKPDDVLFINAAEHFERGKRQNRLTPDHIAKIVSTYQHRLEEPRYSRRVPMSEISDDKNAYNLNISRYVSTAQADPEINLEKVHTSLVEIDNRVKAATVKHNEFLKELGLPLLPM
ncbi:type I restriction-modification system subunit M [Sphingorhabdus sp.]|uniref:type I restriction-modification system subunit M n=1 Tax=Sphingorhabdus sp. TaxID=1902408 RepID=UPI0035B06A9A